MIRNEISGKYDKIPANKRIIRIDKVFNDTCEFTKGIDFRQTLSNNIIEWVSGDDKPSPGSPYKVQAAYIETGIQKFDSNNCERCFGNGWYASLFHDGETAYESTGRGKLVQDFIKVIFSEQVGSEGDVFDLNSALGVQKEHSVSDNIRRTINNAEQQIKRMQEENLANGVSMSPGEKLKMIKINRIAFVREEQTYYVSVNIIPEDDSNILFSYRAG